MNSHWPIQGEWASRANHPTENSEDKAIVYNTWHEIDLRATICLG